MNKLVAIHYSEYFQINHKEFERLGVYDGFVNADSVLHIHPLLIRTTHIPEFCDAYQEFLLHFNNVQHLVRCQINGKAYDKCERALKSLLTFKELPNTGLGYSKGRTGTGISGHLTNVLYQSAREIIEAGISDSNMFILLPLIEDQIGADRISDMTISILRKRFYSYTARVAKELNISCACYQEEQERYLLPMIERKPVVFMPCEFLQELPVAESLQDVSKVCKYNQELRNIICREISITFKEYDQYNKNKIKKIVLGNSQLTQSLLNYLKTVTLKPYDFKKDEIGEYVFSRIDEQIWSKNLITLPLPTTENVLDITIQICQQYKT
ncbi:MAG: hypothetical protein KBS69_01145, partial [Bacteroidales bacterium]|nr:hypothetical protein [Candidatus Colicola caccequi]